MTVCQVAFSVLDLERTLSWYQDAFGFVASGGATGQGGPEVAAMQGLPACRCDMAWLVDDQDFFQLEFFRYTEPAPKPRPYPSSESDIGYTLVGLHVADLDAILHRLSALGTPPVSPVTGTAPERRFLVRDPEGVLLEVLEDDLRAGPGRLPSPAGRAIPVACRFVRLVVEDIAAARRFLVGELGMRDAAVPVHGPEHTALWSGPAPVAVLPLRAGDFLVEVVQYASSRPRPDGYLISDQGLLNIALGSRDVANYHELVARVTSGGQTVSHAQMSMGSAVVRYLTGASDVSVEVLAIPDPAIERAAGFLPPC